MEALYVDLTFLLKAKLTGGATPVAVEGIQSSPPTQPRPIREEYLPILRLTR